MIRYTLRCSDGHVFDSWFQSATAFDGLVANGHVSCATCGSQQVGKTLMAPEVATRASKAEEKVEENPLVELRREVEENATYVGGSFAKKAREMHEGTAPETSIWGEANASEARALIEDGVPVLPLPFKPKRKMQ